MSWPETRFEDLYAEPSRNGVYKPKDHHGAGAKIVNMGELFAYDFVGPQEMARLTMSEYELDKCGLRDGDLLFGRRSLVEAGAGKCSIVEGIVEPTTFESSIIRARLDPHKGDPRFYFYWFRSRQGRGRIRSIVSGTNVKGIRASDLKNLVVVRPDIPTQHRVVECIRPYDDLIETNRRRIALLQDAATLLYREWFILFRFPGHEHIRLVDGLPEGWNRMPASAVMDVLSGGTPITSKQSYWNGGIGFFTPKDATDDPFVLTTEKTLTEEGLRSCNSDLYPRDTVFITARGTVGKLNLAFAPMAMNQSCYALRSKCHFGQRYLYVALGAAVEQVRARATGAVFNAIIVATFDRIPFVVPPEALTRAFEQSIDPIFDQIANLLQQNQKLVAARDLLIPKLMNGELVG